MWQLFVPFSSATFTEVMASAEIFEMVKVDVARVLPQRVARDMKGR